MNYPFFLMSLLIFGTTNAAELTCKQHAAKISDEAERVEYLKFCKDKPTNQLRSNKSADNGSKSDEAVAKIAEDIAKFNKCMGSEVQEQNDNTDKKFDTHTKNVNGCADSAVKK
jgi:hypothetical protein